MDRGRIHQQLMFKLLYIPLLFIVPAANGQLVYDTFNETRVVNGQSTEITDQGIMKFIVQHRFGRIKDGFEEFFGIDQATVRLGLDYGITKDFMLGIGRSSYNKTYDGYLKYRIKQQTTDFPLSLTAHAGATIDGQLKSNEVQSIEFSNRLSYIGQLLISSKLHDRISLQIQPVYIHKNLVDTPLDDNDIFALGAATRIKLSKVYSINMEYYYDFSESSYTKYNSFSLSFDVETKGHFFSVIYTNSQGMTEDAFITESLDTWENGEMHIGFNITRVFNVNHRR